MRYKPIFILCTFILGMHSVILNAQMKSSGMDQERMERDLRIMEGIIDKLISDGSDYHLGERTRGVYIQDYGIVFYTTSNGHFLPEQYAYRIFVGPKIVDLGKKNDTNIKGKDPEENKDLDIIIKSTDDKIFPEQSDHDRYDKEVEACSEDELKQLEQEAIEKIKKHLFTFYKNYVPAIRQLTPNDHIAVMIDFDEWHAEQSDNTYLTSWVTMKDVRNFRNHQSTESQFEKNIHFQIGQPQSDIATDIGIMLEIFGRGLAHENRFDHIKKRGVYLDHFGVLFFMEIPHLNFLRATNESIMIIGEENLKESITYHIEGGKKNEAHKLAIKTSREKDIEEIKDHIFDLLASYGHTLRLAENEWVVLNFNLGESYFLWQSEEKEPSNMLIQIRKKDLDAYNAMDQSLESLWNKAIFKKY